MVHVPGKHGNSGMPESSAYRGKHKKSVSAKLDKNASLTGNTTSKQGFSGSVDLELRNICLINIGIPEFHVFVTLSVIIAWNEFFMII